tara:strand:- start:4060 stop:4185 length:126 start_codon:yes stop_codon:yes gene_type:complete
MINFLDDLLDVLNYWLDRSMRVWLIVLALVVIYNFIKIKGA